MARACAAPHGSSHQGRSTGFALYCQPDPVVKELKALEVEGLSPLGELTKLYELQKAQGEGKGT